MRVTIPCLLALLCAQLAAAVIQQEHRYEFEGATFVATLIYDEAGGDDRSGILMVPNWMGPTEANKEKAARIAGEDHVVFLVDMYGEDIRPSDSDEAGKAAGTVRADRAMMRRRINKALAEFVARAEDTPVDSQRIAAIGFCFGGGVVLELARSGTELPAVVSFHGNLDTPEPAAEGDINTRILVLHGADDPYVSQEQVQAFVGEMRGTGADWQLTQFGGAVHSFTNPGADRPGQAAYDERSAKRAFAAMRRLFSECSL